MTDKNKELESLVSKVDATRTRIISNVEELSDRLQPKKLVADGKAKAEELVHEATAYTRTHPRSVAGGAFVAVGVVVGMLIAWRQYARKNAPVPLYAAYAMEDPTMLDEQGYLRGRKWDRVRDEAANLGARAGETYYAARSKAALLANDTSARASDAAEQARNKARHTAHTARARTGEARDWVSQQAQTNPASILIAGAAAGVLIALLIPKEDSQKKNQEPAVR